MAFMMYIYALITFSISKVKFKKVWTYLKSNDGIYMRKLYLKKNLTKKCTKVKDQ